MVHICMWQHSYAPALCTCFWSMTEPTVMFMLLINIICSGLTRPCGMRLSYVSFCLQPLVRPAHGDAYMPERIYNQAR